MKVMLLAAIAFVLQMAVFTCLGLVIMKIRSEKEYSLSRAALTGYFAWFGVFEVICLTCEVQLIPMRTLALIMAVIMGLLILSGFYSGYRHWIPTLESLRRRLKLHGWTAFFMLLALAASVAFVLLYYDASADSGWYVGTASTALYTDTIGRFDPSTGARVLNFKARYALNCFPYHNAAICSLIKGLPVIVQARSVMSAVNVIMSFISVYQLGIALFPDHEMKEAKVRDIASRPGSYSRRRADLFVVAVFALNLLSSTIYMPGIFLYTRSYEGKALIVNVVIPAALAICVGLWRETALWPMRKLFWIMAAAVCFSASSIMAAIMCVAAILPLAVIRGRWKMLLSLLGALMPVILWALTYYLIQHGIIVLRTWR